MEIENLRRMTDEEMERMGWHTARLHKNPVALEVENGDVVFPAKDPELNGPGALVGINEDDEIFAFDID